MTNTSSNSSLAPFIGASGSGTYTLNIGDNDTGAPGLVLNSFTVRITAVPEPTSLAFLGLFATAGAFVRRRRVR
ncbi:MAG: PEP-CTERM sorting domain-containing protein [Pirellulaceae bacterium]